MTTLTLSRRAALALGAAPLLVPGLARAQAEPVRIGMILSATGGLAAVVPPIRAGVQLAAQEINAAGGVLNGRQIQIVEADDQTNPQAGVQVMTRLVQAENVAAIIGPMASGITIAAANAVSIPAGVPPLSEIRDKVAAAVTQRKAEAEALTRAQQIAEQARQDGGKGDQKGDDKGSGTDLPQVDPEDVGPGSVLDPDEVLPSGGASSGPIRDLVEGLTGGGNNASGQPSIPIVSDVLDGVGQLLEGVLEPVLDPLTADPSKAPKGD